MTMAKPPASPYSGANASAPVDGVKRGCSEKRVIVIDPGHGGTENKPGSSANNATSVSGPKEKTLTLDFALSLRLQLASAEVKAIFESRGYCDVGVILTRETDINLTGSQRVAVATVNKADILISIHFNGGGASAAGPRPSISPRPTRSSRTRPRTRRWRRPSTTASTPRSVRSTQAPRTAAPSRTPIRS
jgi:N-acetylmuramoyl-L-alanine amidase